MPNCRVPFLWSRIHFNPFIWRSNEMIDRALLHLCDTACTRIVVRDLRQVRTGPRFGQLETTSIVIAPFLEIIIDAREKDMASGLGQLHVSASPRRASRGLLSWFLHGVYEWATGCNTQLGKGALIMCQPRGSQMSLRGVLWDHMIHAIVFRSCIIFFSARGEFLCLSRDRVVRSRTCGSSRICWRR